jgi:hypothetical protein
MQKKKDMNRGGSCLFTIFIRGTGKGTGTGKGKGKLKSEIIQVRQDGFGHPAIKLKHYQKRCDHLQDFPGQRYLMCGVAQGPGGQALLQRNV